MTMMEWVVSFITSFLISIIWFRATGKIHREDFGWIVAVTLILMSFVYIFKTTMIM